MAPNIWIVDDLVHNRLPADYCLQRLANSAERPNSLSLPLTMDDYLKLEESSTLRHDFITSGTMHIPRVDGDITLDDVYAGIEMPRRIRDDDDAWAYESPDEEFLPA